MKAVFVFINLTYFSRINNETGLYSLFRVRDLLFHFSFLAVECRFPVLLDLSSR